MVALGMTERDSPPQENAESLHEGPTVTFESNIENDEVSPEEIKIIDNYLTNHSGEFRGYRKIMFVLNRRSQSVNGKNGIGEASFLVYDDNPNDKQPYCFGTYDIRGDTLHGIHP